MQNKMKKWYLDSLNEYGEGDFRSLTWSDKMGKSAKKRYQQMSEYVDFKNSTVYEVGCGWGSFFDFGFDCKEYYGVDIVDEFIKIAEKKYADKPYVNFNNSTLHNTGKVFDVALASGVAGNVGGPCDSPKKLDKFLNNMLDCAKTVMINFPSVHASIRSYNIEYFSPQDVLSTALRHTSEVQLIHKNMHDILLIMRRNNGDN